MQKRINRVYHRATPVSTDCTFDQGRQSPLAHQQDGKAGRPKDTDYITDILRMAQAYGP